MDHELSSAVDPVSQVSLHREEIHSGLCHALRETALANGRLIAPRRLDQIGRQEMEAFLSFLKHEDPQNVSQRGRQLASDGLGHRSILAMTEALRRICWEMGDSNHERVGIYVNALLEGYMAGREEGLLREQARTRKAFLRAQEQRSGGKPGE